MFNIASTFSDQCDFFIVSLNRDVDSSQPDNSIVTDVWCDGPNGERVYFVRTITPLLVRKIIKEVDPDTLFINGIFNPETTMSGILWARLLNRRAIISPRGMLQPWGLKRNQIVKRVYLAVLNLILSKREVWHATDSTEADNIRSVFPKARKIHIASNIPRKVSGPSSLVFPAADGKIKLVFLSLLNSNKNLHMVIDAVQKTHNCSLDIYGPVIDKEYWQLCQSKIADASEIRYRGPVPPWQVPELLAEYHFFILPTQGENFGHAIFDSLASGVPVIISRNTPWTDVDRKAAGFYVDLNEVSILKCLENIARMNRLEYDELRTSARSYASDYWHRKDYVAEYQFLLSEN